MVLMQIVFASVYFAAYMQIQTLIWQQKDRDYDEKLRKFNEENGF